MTARVLIAHAKSEEEFAEKLVLPLHEAGYEVSYLGSVLVGESVVQETERRLREGIPVVLCGTQRAAGNMWVRRLVNAARQIDKGMLFILQMEEEADVEGFAFDEKIARYWEDPAKALAELVASLHKHYPVEEGQQASPRTDAAERHYRDLLLETCDIINLANLPEQDRHIAQKQRELKLRGLYIPLRVHVESVAREESPEDSREEKLWETLEQRRATARQGKAKGGGIQRQRVPVGQRLGQAKRLVILGDPGAGKTTLTRWIATAYLLRLNQDDYWKELPDVSTLPDADWLPVIVRCRDLDLSSLSGSLDDMLKHTLRRAELSDAEGVRLRSLLRERLEKGTALLMLDGLDEITDPAARARFCQQLEQIVIACPAAPIVATSRIVGYREMGYKLGRGFEHLTLAELTPEEKDDFARRWCLLTELPERREAATAELIHDIHSSDRIERLTSNPMLLTTMALVKRKVGKLPRRRADLYWEAVQVLLNWRREIDEPLDWREALPQLEYLAYDMSDRGVQQVRQGEALDLFSRMRQEHPNVHAARNRTPKEFLERLEARTGILVEAGYIRHLGMLEPVYEFRHLTFQEYLAARALVDGRFPGCNPEQSLAAQVGPLAGRTAEASFSEHGPEEAAVVENWREPLRLCAAICSDKDIDSVLLAILTPQEDDSQAVARARAVLAVFCLGDEPNVSAPVAEQVLETFAQEVRGLDGGGGRTTGADLAAMELVGTRWASVLRASLVARFCRELDLTPGALAGFIGAEEAPTDDTQSTNWLVEQARRLRECEASEAVDAALSVMAIACRKKAKLVPDLADALIENLTHGPAVALASAWALASLGQGRRGDTPIWQLKPNEIDRLLAIVKNLNSNPYVVRFLSWILGSQRVEQAAEPLCVWLESPIWEVRQSAAQALGNIKSEAAVAPLIARLEDSDEFVRDAAAEALGKIKSEAAVVPLIARLEDSSGFVRDAAATALGEIKSVAAAAPLIARLQDDEWTVRSAAATALGEIKSEAAVAPLMAHLEDDEWIVRRAAAEALGAIKSEAAVAPLIARLEDSDEFVRDAAAEALGNINSEAAVAPLIARLDDDNVHVRRASATALGNIKSEAAVAPLIARLEDSDADVRRNAVGGLSQGLERTDRVLLSRDFDESAPFLDPRESIGSEFAQKAASELNLKMEEVQTRYEALTDRFHLKLEWRPLP